jgi:hypothetical protein
VQEIGLFSYSRNEVPIEPWGLDDLVVARVRAAAGPRIGVQRITYDSHAFDPYSKPTTLFHSPEASLKDVVQSITHAGECERYVVVVKGSAPYNTTHYTMDGIGVLHVLGKSYLFAISSLRVWMGAPTRPSRAAPAAGA